MSHPGGRPQIAEAQHTARGRRHFLALDSLRGLFACAVAIHHFHSDGYLSRSALIVNAGAFVDFFFVLSGFVIMASYGERLRQGMPVGRFMLLRLGRLYPLHLAVLAAIAVAELAARYLGAGIGLAPTSSGTLAQLVPTLLLVQIFSAADPGNWNPPSWSIAAEIWAYLVFAVACRLSGWRFPIVIAGIVIAAPWFSPEYVFTFRTGALPRCLYGFGIGALCHLVWRGAAPRLRRMGRRLATLAEGGAIAVALVALATGRPLLTYFACPFLFAAVILLLAAERGAVSAALGSRALTTLGTLSFSIYLIHEFVEARVGNLLRLLHVRLDADADRNPAHRLLTRDWPVPFASDLVTLAALAAVVLTAHLTFRFVEEPGRRWSRDRLA